ncbi:MAG: ABC transporter substrate-binding protein, partial [Pseudomonadota bacterium]
GGIDMEAVARLEPDLIEAMYSGLTLAQYRSLSRFAPVIGPPPGTGEFEAGWDQMIRTFGEIMGREADAEKIVTGLEHSFEATRQAHPDWQGASAVVAIPDGPLILTAEDARLQFLERLGFVPHAPAEALSLGGFFYRLDKEITEPLDADLLLWLDFGGGLEPVRRNPLIAKLPSVVEERDVVADPALSAALSYASALSLPYALARLPPLLDAALEGTAAGAPAEAAPTGRAP